MGGEGWLHPLVASDSLSPPPPQSSFRIIACDGVWDVMEDQDAVDLIRAHMGSSSGGGGSGGPVPLAPGRVKTAAQALVDAALAKGSTDNVTVLVVFL